VGWAGPARGAHVVGGDVLGMPAGVDGTERTVAIALAGFLMSRQAQEQLVVTNAWPAIRDDAYADVSAAQRLTFRAVRAALADGWYRPSVAYWPAVTEAIDEAVRRIVQGGDAVQPVLDGLHDRIAAAASAAGAPYPPGS
jgi:trehalose transport system substrate-binding protein